MLRSTKLLLVFALCGSTLVEGAEACRSAMNRDPMAVVFANGMNNTPATAYESLLVLKRAVMSDEATKAVLSDDVVFELAFNPHEPGVAQYVQVAGQKIDDLYSWLMAIVTRRNIAGAPLLDSEGKIKDDAGREVDTSPGLFHGETITDADLAVHLRIYQRLLTEEKRRMVIVSHSQGNFYSNQAFERLDAAQRNKTRQVMVATPTSRVGDGSRRYTTYVNDVIMFLVRQIAPTLEANAGWGPMPDWLGHSFDRSYMRTDYGARRMILDDVVAAFGEIKKPPVAPTAAQNLEVKLTWSGGAATDLDLHVYEMLNGFSDQHVYFKRPNGRAGKLTSDATPGLETYLATCDGLIPGRYAIAIAYMKGEGPASATLTVDYGGETISTQTISFPEADAIGGVTSPKRVLGLEAADDGSEGFTIRKFEL